jgi:hypothetical protein
MEEFSVVIMKRFRSNWFEKTKGQHKNKKAMELLVFLELSFRHCKITAVDLHLYNLIFVLVAYEAVSH